MPTIAEQLNKLIELKTQLADNLIEKGVEANSNETFNTLVPKVLDIQSGGSAESCLLSLEVNPVLDGPSAPGMPDSISYELHCVELGGLHTDSETFTSNSTVSYSPLKNSILNISHNRGLYVTTSGSITLLNSFSDSKKDRYVCIYYIEDNSTINIRMY